MTDHRRGKHSAPKPARKAPKRAGAILSVASVGSIAMTGSSTMAASTEDTSTTLLADPIVANDNTISIPAVKVTDTQTTTLRAVAASRSDARTSLEDTKNLNKADQGVTSIDLNANVSASERRVLAGVSGADASADAVLAEAQSQARSEVSRLEQAQAAVRGSAVKKVTSAPRVNTGPGIDVTYAATATTKFPAYTGVKSVPIRTGYKLTARFGQHGRLWSGGWHTGLDFQVPTGTKVYAAANGEIINAGWAGAYGYRIEIRHADGFVTTYNHLSKIEVSKGLVRAGQEIGRSGSTGHTTGAHLHFEVMFDDLLVNPSKWLWGK
jgi:murein DD-endopeptidase MepM/ murein hydrolase activator NlpD